MNNEREFINYFKSKVNARYERCQDKDKQNHHVTIRDVSSQVVFTALKAEGYTLAERLYITTTISMLLCEIKILMVFTI